MHENIVMPRVTKITTRQHPKMVTPLNCEDIGRALWPRNGDGLQVLSQSSTPFSSRKLKESLPLGSFSPRHRLHSAGVPPAAIPSGEDDLRAALPGLVASGHTSLVGVASV